MFSLLHSKRASVIKWDLKLQIISSHLKTAVMKQVKTAGFAVQDIYCGIDVHKKAS
jgi:hypothetical protein